METQEADGRGGDPRNDVESYRLLWSAWVPAESRKDQLLREGVLLVPLVLLVMN